ncbi:MAG: hypothetical protein QOJ07_1310 [Thermoleophilaceae bacterium]|jgi:hypothetical protein|nr:hypothetical protein [Thermoleophilaceae bacterium]
MTDEEPLRGEAKYKATMADIAKRNEDAHRAGKQRRQEEERQVAEHRHQVDLRERRQMADS